MKRILALLLTLCLLFSAACTAAAPAAPAAPEVISAEKETPAPTAVPTPEPTPSPTPTPSPSELWASFDKQFFIEYLSQDISSLHQYVKDPEAMGFDMSKVEISLGHYCREESDKWFDWVEKELDALSAIPVEGLSEKELAGYNTVKTYLTWELESEDFYGYDEPLTAYTGIQVDMPLIFWMYTIESKEDAETYLKLLATMPEFVQELIEYEHYRTEIGLFMTENALDDVLKDLKSIIDKGDDLFLVRTFNEAVDKLGLDEAEAEAMKAENFTLISEGFHNSYQNLYDALESYRGYCRKNVGLCSLDVPHIKEYYAWKLKQSTGEEITPADASTHLFAGIFTAWSEGNSASKKLDDPYKEFDLSFGSLEENLTKLKETLLPQLPELPETELVYLFAPEEMKEIFSPAAYLCASFDDWKDNTILLNEPEKDTSLASTLAHESYCGHLYQYVYHRSGGFSLAQQLCESTAFAESWSQFSEYLLAESSTSLDNNELRFCFWDDRFQSVLMAYCSMVVNAFKYDETAFGDYLQQVFGYDPYTAGILYKCAVDMPFYYTPYAYGFTRIYELYTTYGKGDVKTFAQRYLDCGPAYFHEIEAAMSK